MNIFRITHEMAGSDASVTVNALLKEIGPNATLLFEPGDYPLSSPFQLTDKHNLTIDGSGCTFMPYFDRESDFESSANVFECNGCTGLTLRRFTIHASSPANTAAAVLNVTDTYADVEFHPDVPMTGKEYFIDGDAFLATGEPSRHRWVNTEYNPAIRTVIAGELPCSAPRKLNVPHEMLGPQRARVYSKRLDGLQPGMLCCVQHSYYGLVACVLRNCADTVVENVSITNYGGFGFIVFPRCKNLTFRQLRIFSPSFEHQPISINADGIHVTGLTGKLLLEDCFFERLGDDNLNVHTQVMTVKAVGTGCMSVGYEKPPYLMPPVWAEQGDRLWVYDPETLAMKGEILVKKYENNTVSFSQDLSFVARGDLVTNRFYFPDVEIRGCTFSNSLRGLCLQGADSAVVENCRFLNASGVSVYVSSAFHYWMEAGPMRRLRIINNVFDGCRIPGRMPESSAILIRINGEKHENLAGIHQDIAITGNSFRNLVHPAITAKSTAGLRISGNTMENCAQRDGFDLSVRFCSDVSLENNRVLDDGAEREPLVFTE